MKRKLEMDMTKGPIIKQLIVVAMPLMFMNLLQVLFNTADVTILGMFTNDDAVAGVGATSSLINLLISLFTGLAIGVNVVVAKAIGAKEEERVKKQVGTSLFTAIVGGAMLMLIGVFLSRKMLILMDTAPEVLDYATTYLTIYFLGAPALLLYNFCAALLRAVGETMRPFIYLAIGGAINVVLNVFFILVLGMDIDGVAIATVVSTVFSAVMCLRLLIINKNGALKIEFKYLRFYKKEFFEIALIGIPSGIQGALFSISNVLIQSSVNSFGKEVMAGNTCAQQLDHFIAQILSAFSQSAISFISQNYGAKNFDRIKKIIFLSLLLVLSFGVSSGIILLFITKPFVNLTLSGQEARNAAVLRAEIMVSTFTIASTMDLLAYSLRGLNKSVTAMFVSLIGVCAFRIIWVKTIFTILPTLTMLYICYPISWLITGITHGIILIIRFKNEKKKHLIAQETIVN